jgi:hypothetical protein
MSVFCVYVCISISHSQENHGKEKDDEGGESNDPVIGTLLLEYQSIIS